ncbi:ABC transporter permease [Pusillimonas sp. NJUB218]|uniref:ABC transporter permease n=1 Tax=Pusillimonas sp. NJUB218 TaxID=2023230 RepID=UPI000F4B46F2|nr:ABC transporter permease [Pusillimonas sp. NJUB218]ROT44040.1 ABC transporter permease [Pusillimonas sp. NJUB218]
MSQAAQRPTRWYENPFVGVIMAVLLMGLIWSAAARMLGFSSFPGPIAAVKELRFIVVDPGALWAIAQSVGRMFTGYFWALLFAIPLGLAMGRSRAMYQAFYPLVSLAYPMPKAALMPILMLWFGLGSFSKILVIAMGVSLPVLYHSYQGALRVEKKLVWTAQAMGMGPVGRLFKVVLPAALPEIMIGCRVGVVMALIVMVSSEMIARQEGVGNLLFTSMDMAQYETVYAVILVLAVLGFVLDALFERVRRYLTRWADNNRGVS